MIVVLLKPIEGTHFRKYINVIIHRIKKTVLKGATGKNYEILVASFKHFFLLIAFFLF